MPSHDGRAGFVDLVRTTAQDFRENFNPQFVIRETDNIHCGGWCPAHRKNVAEGIGRRNLSKDVGIVDEGCEEVQRLDQKQIVRNFEYAGIAETFSANYQSFISGLGQVSHNLCDRFWRDLAGSSSARCVVRETFPFSESQTWSSPNRSFVICSKANDTIDSDPVVNNVSAFSEWKLECEAKF